MSSEEGPVAWLRRQAEARLALAREACEGTDGRWWRRTADTGHSDSGSPEPAGALYAGAPVLDFEGDLIGGDCTVVYDEGRPSDAQFGHIAANDPRDAIARCEAELAVLDRCEGMLRYDEAGNDENFRDGRDPDEIMRDEALADLAGDVLSLIASGYRHHAGYADHRPGQG